MLQPIQPEAILEKNLVTQLRGMGYEHVVLPDQPAILLNLQEQLEKHNHLKFSTNEFLQVLTNLKSGNVFDRAHLLRDKKSITRDNGEPLYIEFLNTDHWCQNKFQVCQQVIQSGSYCNRYDVTIFLNGLPLVQVELKRRWLELKEAFNQTNRYQRHSYWAGLGCLILYSYLLSATGLIPNTTRITAIKVLSKPSTGLMQKTNASRNLPNLHRRF